MGWQILNLFQIHHLFNHIVMKEVPSFESYMIERWCLKDFFEQYQRFILFIFRIGILSYNMIATKFPRIHMYGNILLRDILPYRQIISYVDVNWNITLFDMFWSNIGISMYINKFTRNMKNKNINRNMNRLFFCFSCWQIFGKRILISPCTSLHWKYTKRDRKENYMLIWSMWNIHNSVLNCVF